MADIGSVLADTRSAVTDLIAAAEASSSVWTTPRAPGKWSPSQVVEHVARSLEESANVVAGSPSKFPTFPAFLRPVVRNVFFNRVLKKQEFPKARTAGAMNPSAGPGSPAEGRARLEEAMRRFERECQAAASRGAAVD